MAQEAFTLSVVCPAFNEEEVLPLFHPQLAAVLDGLPDACTAEVLYVDDGSRDRTLEVLQRPGRPATRASVTCPSAGTSATRRR